MRFKVFCFITILVIVYGYHSKSIEKIVHGRDALPGEFPFAANILMRYNMFQHCGGSIVSKIFIMTACHCIGEFQNETFEPIEVSSILITAGHLRRKVAYPREGQIVRYADMSIIHPKCCEDPETGSYVNDIGFFRLTYPLQWTNYVKQLPILKSPKNERSKEFYEIMTKKMIDSKANCSSFGWGMTTVRETGEYANPAAYLKKIDLKMLNYSTCQRSVEGDGTMCAQSFEKGDLCKGDSGSALICDGHVYGIVSKNPRCGEMHNPSLHTRIEFVFDFYVQFLDD